MRNILVLLLAFSFPVLAFAGQYDFPAGDGSYDRDANSTKSGHQMAVRLAGGVVKTGTLTVSARAPGSSDFIEVGVFNSVSVTAPIAIAFSGRVEQFRFTTASITNSTTVTVTDSDTDRPIGSFYGVE